MYVSPYRPQANLSEHCNKQVIGHLKHYLNAKQNDWPSYLQAAAAAYNTKRNSSMLTSPHTALFGYEFQLPGLEQLKQLEYITFEDYQKRLEYIREAAKTNLITALCRESYYVNLHRKEPTQYSENQLVMIRFPKITTNTTAFGRQMAKLKAPYKGVYRVVKKLSDLNYVVELQNTLPGRAPRTFTTHVTRMKPFYAIDRIEEIMQD